MPIKRIHNETFEAEILFIFDEDKIVLNDYLKKKTTKDFTQQIEDSNGFFSSWDGKIYLVITKECGNIYKTISHEAMHIVFHVFRHIGIKLSENSEEAYCYFLGWIVGECTRIYNLYRKSELVKGDV